MENALAHTIAEASARSGIGRTAIYELINTGQLFVAVAVVGDASKHDSLIELVDERNHPVVVSHHKQPIIGLCITSPIT